MKISLSLFKLLTKDVEFYWNNECQCVFYILKENLSSAPVLRGLKWNLPFHILTDASDSTIGVVLGQNGNILTYVIYFISKNLSLDELNYTVIEKDFLAVAYAINKFRHYFIGYEVFIHIDHYVVRYLMKKPTTNGKNHKVAIVVVGI
jgi:hypothetical protein